MCLSASWVWLVLARCPRTRHPDSHNAWSRCCVAAEVGVRSTSNSVIVASAPSGAATCRPGARAIFLMFGDASLQCPTQGRAIEFLGASTGERAGKGWGEGESGEGGLRRGVRRKVRGGKNTCAQVCLPMCARAPNPNPKP
jgi:hypothetical protein